MSSEVPTTLRAIRALAQEGGIERTAIDYGSVGDALDWGSSDRSQDEVGRVVVAIVVVAGTLVGAADGHRYGCRSRERLALERLIPALGLRARVMRTLPPRAPPQAELDFGP